MKCLKLQNCWSDKKKWKLCRRKREQKSFLDGIKNIFHNYLSIIIWWKKRKIADTSLQVPKAQTDRLSHLGDTRKSSVEDKQFLRQCNCLKRFAWGFIVHTFVFFLSVNILISHWVSAVSITCLCPI